MYRGLDSRPRVSVFFFFFLNNNKKQREFKEIALSREKMYVILLDEVVILNEIQGGKRLMKLVNFRYSFYIIKSVF